MELITRSLNLRTLTVSEIETIEAGALFPWPALLAGIAAACMTNIPEVIGGMIDGWNAYH